MSLAPMTGQFPDPNKIACYTCMFRDKTTIEIGDAVKPVGVTRSTCEMYEFNKPSEVLFQNAECEKYVRDWDVSNGQDS